MKIKELEKENYDIVNYIFKQGIETDLATFKSECYNKNYEIFSLGSFNGLN